MPPQAAATAMCSLTRQPKPSIGRCDSSSGQTAESIPMPPQTPPHAMAPAPRRPLQCLPNAATDGSPRLQCVSTHNTRPSHAPPVYRRLSSKRGRAKKLDEHKSPARLTSAEHRFGNCNAVATRFSISADLRI